MKFFCHVLYSWLLAIAIVLIGLYSYEMITLPYSPRNFFTSQLFMVPFIAMLVALPSLFLGLLFLRFIQTTQYTVLEKFLLWYVAALIAVILNIVFLAMLFAPQMIEPVTFFSFWPAYVAVIITLSIRVKYFLLLPMHPG
jgi:hypothetical protein